MAIRGGCSTVRCQGPGPGANRCKAASPTAHKLATFIPFGKPKGKKSCRQTETEEGCTKGTQDFVAASYNSQSSHSQQSSDPPQGQLLLPHVRLLMQWESMSQSP
eukprot:2268558-Rhodomonas_salina.2